MGSRSVRLDQESESALSEVMAKTGLSISEVIKKGLIAYRETARRGGKKSPADFFREFDLGEGGYGTAPARQAQEAVKNKLRNQRKQRDTG